MAINKPKGSCCVKKLFCVILILALVIPFGTDKSTTFSESKPEKLRIGYVESEVFDNFSRQLSEIFAGFQKLGLVESDYKVDLKEADTSKIWRDICNNYYSDKIELVQGMYFNMKNMPESDYAAMVNRDDVDLVVVMGTVAGKYFLEHEKKNKFMVLACADPISAGIVKNEIERFRDNSFAHIDRTRYERQIIASHQIFSFKKIGVVYQDTPEAFSYSAIDKLRKLSSSLGFDIIEKHVVEAQNDNDYERYYKDLKQSYKELANEGIDSLYITTATIENERLKDLLKSDIYVHNIFTIAQTSEQQVEYGALIGFVINDGMEQGYFAASQIKSYLEGTPFDQLEQVNDDTPKISLNYDVAKLINLKIPLSTLLIIDSIYVS